jgi:hypothetical protein
VRAALLRCLAGSNGSSSFHTFFHEVGINHGTQVTLLCIACTVHGRASEGFIARVQAAHRRRQHRCEALCHALHERGPVLWLSLQPPHQRAITAKVQGQLSRRSERRKRRQQFRWRSVGCCQQGRQVHLMYEGEGGPERREVPFVS